MKIHPMSHGTKHTSANVAGNSVNSILLDPEPQNPNDRMLVAGFVSTNESGGNLTLRETTLMPNVRGMVGLMCLLFSPCAELRVNKYKTKYTGALCGLGYDPATNQSYDPINDLEVHFDAEFTLTDIEHINMIRFWMSRFFNNAGGDDVSNSVDKRRDLVSRLLDLMKRRRKYQSFMSDARCFRWNCLDPKSLIKPLSKSDEYDGETDVFKLHSGVSLEKREPPEAKHEIKKNLIELWKIASCDIKDYSDGICKLCNNLEFKNRMAIKLHLASPEHRYNELRVFKMNLEKFPEVAYIPPSLKQSTSRTGSYGQPGEKFDCPTPRGRARGKPVYKNGYRDPNLPGSSRY